MFSSIELAENGNIQDIINPFRIIKDVFERMMITLTTRNINLVPLRYSLFPRKNAIKSEPIHRATFP